MSLDLEEARKISRLARLSPETAEAEAAMVQELGAIVDYFGQLADYEADPEPAVGGPQDTESSRERADAVGACLDRSLFEANAPESRDGFLVVPRIKAGAAKA